MRLHALTTVAALAVLLALAGCSAQSTTATTPESAVGEDRPPVVQFSFYHDDANGTVVVRHATGEAVETERVTVVVGDRRIPWTPRAGDAVEPGDSMRVNAAPGDQIRVVWQSGGEREELFRLHVPSTPDRSDGSDVQSPPRRDCQDDERELVRMRPPGPGSSESTTCSGPPPHPPEPVEP